MPLAECTSGASLRARLALPLLLLLALGFRPAVAPHAGLCKVISFKNAYDPEGFKLPDQPSLTLLNLTRDANGGIDRTSYDIAQQQVCAFSPTLLSPDVRLPTVEVRADVIFNTANRPNYYLLPTSSTKLVADGSPVGTAKLALEGSANCNGGSTDLALTFDNSCTDEPYFLARLGLELALDGRKPSARGALAAWFRWPPPPAGATGLPGNWAPLLTFARPSSLFSVSYTYPTSWLGATAITGATTLPWKFFTLFLGSPFAGSSGVNCSMSLQDHPDVFWCLPDVGEAKYRDDVWHHLLLVQDGASDGRGYGKLYIDSKLAGSLSLHPVTAGGAVPSGYTPADGPVWLGTALRSASDSGSDDWGDDDLLTSAASMTTFFAGTWLRDGMYLNHVGGFNLGFMQMWFDIIKDAGPLACLRATHQLVSRQWLRDQDAASWPADWEVDWVTYLPSATPPRVEVLQLARRADAAGANPALEATVAMIAAGGSKVTYDYVCTDAAVNSLTHIDYPDLCGAWADPYAATAGAAANFTISCGGFAQLTRYVRLYLTGPDYYKVMATVASRDAFIDQVQTDLDAFLALPAGSSQMVEIQPGSIVAYVAITFPSWYTNTLIGNALSSLSTAAFTSLFSAAFITTYGVTGLAVTEVSTLAFSTSGFTVAVTTSEVAAQDTLTAVASTTIAVTAGASVAVSAAVSSAVTQAMSVLLATAAKVGVESLSSAVGVNNLIDHLQVFVVAGSVPANVTSTMRVLAEGLEWINFQVPGINPFGTESYSSVAAGDAVTVRRRGLLMTPATEEIIDQIWGSAASRMFVIAALGVLVFMIHWLVLALWPCMRCTTNRKLPGLLVYPKLELMYCHATLMGASQALAMLFSLGSGSWNVYLVAAVSMVYVVLFVLYIALLLLRIAYHAPELGQEYHAGLNPTVAKKMKADSKGRRALFAFVFKRQHGWWGDPLFKERDHEPARTRHYLRTGISLVPILKLLFRQQQLLKQMSSRRHGGGATVTPLDEAIKSGARPEAQVGQRLQAMDRPLMPKRNSWTGQAVGEGRESGGDSGGNAASRRRVDSAGSDVFASANSTDVIPFTVEEGGDSITARRSSALAADGGSGSADGAHGGRHGVVVFTNDQLSPPSTAPPQDEDSGSSGRRNSATSWGGGGALQVRLGSKPPSAASSTPGAGASVWPASAARTPQAASPLSSAVHGVAAGIKRGGGDGNGHDHRRAAFKDDEKEENEKEAVEEKPGGGRALARSWSVAQARNELRYIGLEIQERLEDLYTDYRGTSAWCTSFKLTEVMYRVLMGATVGLMAGIRTGGNAASAPMLALGASIVGIHGIFVGMQFFILPQRDYVRLVCELLSGCLELGSFGCQLGLQLAPDSAPLSAAQLWLSLSATVVQFLAVWIILLFKLLGLIKVKQIIKEVKEQYEEDLAAGRIEAPASPTGKAGAAVSGPPSPKPDMDRAPTVPVDDDIDNHWHLPLEMFTWRRGDVTSTGRHDGGGTADADREQRSPRRPPGAAPPPSRPPRPSTKTPPTGGRRGSADKPYEAPRPTDGGPWKPEAPWRMF